MTAGASTDMDDIAGLPMDMVARCGMSEKV